jgi:hypothetical protein
MYETFFSQYNIEMMEANLGHTRWKRVDAKTIHFFEDLSGNLIIRTNHKAAYLLG